MLKRYRWLIGVVSIMLLVLVISWQYKSRFVTAIANEMFAEYSITVSCLSINNIDLTAIHFDSLCLSHPHFSLEVSDISLRLNTPLHQLTSHFSETSEPQALIDSVHSLNVSRLRVVSDMALTDLQKQFLSSESSSETEPMVFSIPWILPKLSVKQLQLVHEDIGEIHTEATAEGQRAALRIAYYPLDQKIPAYVDIHIEQALVDAQFNLLPEHIQSMLNILTPLLPSHTDMLHVATSQLQKTSWKALNIHYVGEDLPVIHLQAEQFRSQLSPSIYEQLLAQNKSLNTYSSLLNAMAFYFDGSATLTLGADSVVWNSHAESQLTLPTEVLTNSIESLLTPLALTIDWGLQEKGDVITIDLPSQIQHQGHSVSSADFKLARHVSRQSDAIWQLHVNQLVASESFKQLRFSAMNAFQLAELSSKRWRVRSPKMQCLHQVNIHDVEMLDIEQNSECTVTAPKVNIRNAETMQSADITANFDDVNWQFTVNSSLGEYINAEVTTQLHVMQAKFPKQQVKAPIALALNMTAHEGNLLSDTAVTVAEMAPLNISTSGKYTQGFLLEKQHVVIDEWQTPMYTVTDLVASKIPDSLALRSGMVNVKGEGWWSLEHMQFDVDWHIDDIAGEFNDAVFADVSVANQFQLTDTMLNIQPLDLHVGAMDTGVIVSNSQASIVAGQWLFNKVNPEFSLTLQDSTGDVLGGHYALQPVTLFPTFQDNVMLQINEIDLADLAKLKEDTGIILEGKISAEIPIKILAQGALIENGRLHGITEGRLVFKDNSALDAISQRNPQLAQVATYLKHLKFSELSANITMSETGDVRLVCNIVGENPDVNRAVAFNYSHEENLFALLKALRIADQLVDAIR